MNMQWYLHIAQGETPLQNMPTEFWLLVVGLMLIMIFVMFRRMRKHYQQAPPPHQSAGDRVRQLQQQQPDRQLHNRINELMAELADLSRQINGQLDTRLARMDLLLREADRKIETLANLTDHPPDAHDEQTDTSSPSPKPETSANTPASSTPSQPSPDTDLDNTDLSSADNQTILSLAGQGWSALRIAQKCHRPVGEIQLILALKEKNNPSDS